MLVIRFEKGSFMADNMMINKMLSIYKKNATSI